jgi:hypothetical protein
MNDGIRPLSSQLVQMPRGLLGKPTPVPTPKSLSLSDRDAETYIAAVEAADGLQLEQSVRAAILQFVVGLKEDNVWRLLKSTCILSGAKTLSGALVPLVGGSITNANFVSVDYNRRTGLQGNGTNKSLRTSLVGNTLSGNSYHMFVSGPNLPRPLSAQAAACGVYQGNYPSTVDLMFANFGVREARSGTALAQNTASVSLASAITAGTLCVSKTSTVDVRLYQNGVTCGYATAGVHTASMTTLAFSVFGRNENGTTLYHSAARLNFFSIGDGLSMTASLALHERVTALTTAIAGL